MKKPDDPKPAPAKVPADMVSPRKAFAMGLSPTVCTGKGVTTK